VHAGAQARLPDLPGERCLREAQIHMGYVLQANDKHATIADLPQHSYESQIFRNRELSYNNIFGNDTDSDDFTSYLRPASDVSVSAFKASVVFNLVVFAVLMASYETLHRLFPSVYAAQKARIRACNDEGNSFRCFVCFSRNKNTVISSISAWISWVKVILTFIRSIIMHLPSTISRSRYGVIVLSLTT
jgi:hypothetical protein